MATVITTPALAAHHRLLEQLPVHRHEQRPPAPPAYEGRPPFARTVRRRAQIRRWLAQKVPPKQVEMARRLGITRLTVSRHIDAIERGDTSYD